MKYQIHEVLLFLLNKRLYSTSKRKKVEEYLERQASDQYSRQAKEHSYRARSAFKLLQINEKFQFIRPGTEI
jgi:23S rRNA (uridine2552-2'-O)-methyltransferase